MEELDNLSLEHEVVLDDVGEQYKKEMKELAPKDDTKKTTKDVQTVAQGFGLKEYNTYENIRDFYKEICQNSSGSNHSCTYSSAGQSHEGRELPLVVRFSYLDSLINN